MRVLVCGGRQFSDRQSLWAYLDQIGPSVIEVVISGMAPGADTYAAEWAKRSGVELAAFPADWAREGRSAGPIRNKRMLDEGKPDLVVVFPGGRGTEDMVRRATRAGIAVAKVDQ